MGHTSLEGLFQLLGDIIDIIEDTLVVVAPKRCKYGITHFLAVDGQLIETQSTDIEGGPFQTVTDTEVAFQVDTLL